MRQEWQLTLLWGVMVGSGTGVTSMVLAAVIATRWFDERRGLVLGALSAANATGQLVFLPMLARVVDARGWRTACLTVAAASVVVFVLVLIFMRDRPNDLGLRRYGERDDSAGTPHSVAVHSHRSMRFASPPVACVLGAGRDVFHLRRQHQRSDRHALDRRVPRRRHPASPLGTAPRHDGHLRHRRHHRVGLADRPLFEPLSALHLLHTAGLSLLYLPVTLAHTSSNGLGVFAVFYGLDWVATVPPTVRLTSEAFGRENTGVIYGWIAASHQLGASLAAFGAGAIRTGLGDYNAAFWIAGTLCALAGLSFLTVDRKHVPGVVTRVR